MASLGDLEGTLLWIWRHFLKILQHFERKHPEWAFSAVSMPPFLESMLWAFYDTQKGIPHNVWQVCSDYSSDNELFREIQRLIRQNLTAEMIHPAVLGRLEPKKSVPINLC